MGSVQYRLQSCCKNVLCAAADKIRIYKRRDIFSWLSCFLDSISDLSVVLLPRLLQALSERLFYYIAVSLLPHDTLCELEAAVEAGRALSPILQWHKHPNDYFSREAQNLYFNSLRTYWQELIDLTRYGCTSLVSRRLTVPLPVSDFSFRLFMFSLQPRWGPRHTRGPAQCVQEAG